MSWRDQLGPASFRGAEFFVDSAELIGGRATVRHEYPFRDIPFVEDLGRLGRAFPISGYVLGDDYFAARDALLAALETEGPGELVHPYQGTRRVICAHFRVHEATAEGGIARFDLEFEETEEASSFPEATPSATERVDEDGDKIVAALRARAAAKAALSLPSSALEELDQVIQDAKKALDAALQPLTMATQELAAVKHQLDNIALDGSALARTPADALDAFQGAVSAFGNASPIDKAVDALLGAYGFTPSVARPSSATATRAAEQEGYDLLLAIIRTSVVVQAARLCAAAEYDTYDAAVSARDAVAAALEDQAGSADDDTYASIAQLRADLVRAVPGEARDLPRLVRHTPAFTVPSLVLAHRLYGDVAREGDLVTRNRIVRPGFILGGRELEVLADA
jgi:prophage DNA circulation protein